MWQINNSYQYVSTHRLQNLVMKWVIFIVLLINQPLCAQQVDSIFQTGAENTNAYLPLLKGKSVGLVCNQGSKIGATPLHEALAAMGVKVKKIFFPEHGFEVNADAGALLKSQRDLKNGVKYISLYGKKNKPTAADLADLDYLVFDLQDVGVRCYTYLSTLHNVMEACAENKKILLVFDRPNPNGDLIDGPVLEPTFKSFVGMDPVPFVYGMSIGEYALLLDGEGWLKGGLSCHLKVIPMKGYSHHPPFPQLSVAPSPNLNTPQSIRLYPSLAFFEGTIVSVGRGTKTPFCWFGFPGFKQPNCQFTPLSKAGSQHPPYQDTICSGIALIDSAQAISANNCIHLNWLITAYKAYSNSNKSFFNSFFNYVAGNNSLQQQLKDGLTAQEIRQSWQPGLEQFKKIRSKYLLYPN